MKVASKDLYGALRAELAPILGALGFKALREGGLGWERSTAGGTLSLWFRCDKWGWDESWGSKFTLEFAFQPDGAPGQAKGRFDRIGYLLEGFPELDELRRRNNAVIERLPGTLGGKLVASRLSDGTTLVVLGEQIDPKPAIHGRDIWLNYHSLDDAKEWARYFRDHLPHFLSLFENGTFSAQRQARVRFDAMMSQVRNTPGIEGRARILEDYAQSEDDACFSSSALHWLRTLREETADTPPDAHAEGDRTRGSAA
ncbi:MAG: hypothetical protein WCJ69_11295 [Betaproteobacteria bacterium]